MARLQFTSLFVCALLALFWPKCSATNSFSLQEMQSQLQAIKDNYEEMKKELVNTKTSLESKVLQLEDRVGQLEAENKQLRELLLAARKTSFNGSPTKDTAANEKITAHTSSKAMPTSCMDLQQLGHSLSGIYSVKGAKSVEAVYCDFSQGINTWLGYTDIKSVPTYFYVQRTSSFSRQDIPIPFEIATLNEGGAMDVSSGIFTAPRSGRYFFSLSGIAEIQPTTSRNAFGVFLLVNGNGIGYGWADESGNSVNDYETYSLQSTLQLSAGDRVWLQIGLMAGSSLYDGTSRHTHFTGWLLQEDM